MNDEQSKRLSLKVMALSDLVDEQPTKKNIDALVKAMVEINIRCENSGTPHAYPASHIETMRQHAKDAVDAAD